MEPRKILTYGNLRNSLELRRKELRLDSLIALYNTDKYDDSYGEVIQFDGVRVTIRPLTENIIDRVTASRLKAQQTNTLFLQGRIPASLIYLSHVDRTMIWKVAGGQREITSVKDIQHWKSGTALFPPELVFVYKDDTLFVYAYRKERGEENLYLLDIPHSDNEGYHCVSTKSVETLIDAEEVMEQLEVHFWQERYVSWAHSDFHDPERQQEICNLYFDLQPWNKQKFNKLRLWKTLPELLSSIISHES